MKRKIAEIIIGNRHRKDMGELRDLADSIWLEGLLQPIGITEHDELVFGERRLRACRDLLGWTEIEARVVKVSSIVAGEFHENEVRKDFTPSERVAIERAINAEIEKQKGGRGRKLLQNLGEVFDSVHHTLDQSARLAGFGNRETARQARKVVDHGVPELVEAMDRGEISISFAGELADQPHEEQRKLLILPTKRQAIEESKRTGKSVLGRDNRLHMYVPPEIEARTDLWLNAKEVIWATADLSIDPHALAAAVPVYQRKEFGARLKRARAILDSLSSAWEAFHERRNIAAE